jgi:predicted short-subunit dehydrogenase-like oxidoreductase (DUF2520 family)
MRERTGRKPAAPFRVAIVGAGKVGSVLGRILADNGARIECVVSRTLASARRAGRFLGCRNVTTSLNAIPPTVNLVYLTVPHAAVEEVARGLAGCDQLKFRRMAVCHASGMLTAAALEPVRVRGALVFSFHPLQTFPRDFHPKDILLSARGIYYGIDGIPAAQRKARALARALEGTVIEIPPAMRELYHAACVVASNHVTTVLAVVEEMYAAFGGKPRGFARVFMPIVSATLGNIARTSPAAALSGPVARGGVDTVARHLDVVRARVPHLMPYFVAVSLETVRLARKKGSISDRQGDALRTLITSPMYPTPYQPENP